PGQGCHSPSGPRCDAVAEIPPTATPFDASMRVIVRIHLVMYGGSGWPILREMRIAMANASESVEADMPVSETYEQWTRFEYAPEFMPGVLFVQIGGAWQRFKARMESGSSG
ncbi:hypothetical protein ACFQ36_20550, partial [Arthrobacter sp. GCM10027362]